MSSDEVRLWRNEWPTSMFGPPYKGSGEIRYETCERPALSEPGVWMRAAKHAALMRVVEAVGERVAHENGVDGVGFCDSADRERHRWLVRSENAAYRAYAALVATATERQGEAPRA